MKDYVHIVSGASLEVSLKTSFDLCNIPISEIISLNDDLRVGPIKGIDTEAGYQKRSEWWNTIANRCFESERFASYYDDIKKWHGSANY